MESPHLPDRVEHWPIERLRRYERNARTHTAAQVDQVATSIVEFGFTNPLLVDPDCVLIAGHCRLAAASKLGLTHVPVIVLGHLTEAQRRAYVIADNQLALQSGWDLGVLEAEVEALQVEGFDVELLGFDADEDECIVVTREYAQSVLSPLPELDWAESLRHKRAKHYRAIVKPLPDGKLPKQDVDGFWRIMWNDELFAKSLGPNSFRRFAHACVIEDDTIIPLLDENEDRLVVYRREGWKHVYAELPELA